MTTTATTNTRIDTTATTIEGDTISIENLPEYCKGLTAQRIAEETLAADDTLASVTVCFDLGADVTVTR